MKSNMIKEKMVKLASQLSAPELMEQARKINEMFDDWADDVLMVLLSALESKIPESDYIQFCDSLLRRLDLLALFRIAGYHNDQGQFVRLLVENRISKQAADKSYKDGQDMRANGVKCNCYECRKN